MRQCSARELPLVERRVRARGRAVEDVVEARRWRRRRVLRVCGRRYCERRQRDASGHDPLAIPRQDPSLAMLNGLRGTLCRN